MAPLFGVEPDGLDANFRLRIRVGSRSVYPVDVGGASIHVSLWGAGSDEGSVGPMVGRLVLALGRDGPKSSSESEDSSAGGAGG
jgi:hypothetical protein